MILDFPNFNNCACEVTRKIKNGKSSDLVDLAPYTNVEHVFRYNKKKFTYEFVKSEEVNNTDEESDTIDYFIKGKNGKPRGVKSIYEAFVNLDIDSIDDILSFIRKYGYFYPFGACNGFFFGEQAKNLSLEEIKIDFRRIRYLQSLLAFHYKRSEESVIQILNKCLYIMTTPSMYRGPYADIAYSRFKYSYEEIRNLNQGAIWGTWNRVNFALKSGNPNYKIIYDVSIPAGISALEVMSGSWKSPDNWYAITHSESKSVGFYMPYLLDMKQTVQWKISMLYFLVHARNEQSFYIEEQEMVEFLYDCLLDKEWNPDIFDFDHLEFLEENNELKELVEKKYMGKVRHIISCIINTEYGSYMRESQMIYNPTSNDENCQYPNINNLAACLIVSVYENAFRRTVKNICPACHKTFYTIEGVKQTYDYVRCANKVHQREYRKTHSGIAKTAENV